MGKIRRGAAPITLGGAVDLPSESDPEDEDFEGDEELDDDKVATRASAAGGRSSQTEEASKAICEAAKAAWAEMQTENAAATAAAMRRRPCIPQDPLFREFQRRHPRSPKRCSRTAVLSELAKYSNVRSAAEAQPPPRPTAAELRRRSCTGADAAVPAAVSATLAAAPVVVQQTVRFAGESISVKRRVERGSNEEKSQARRRKIDLGGQLSGLDAWLQARKVARDVSVVEKSGLDWKSHKDERGLDAHDLERGPYAGALERRDFLDRATARTEAAHRAGVRAAARQAAAASASETPSGHR
eukprot:gnl/TRDRNA2_/TRDRNA2_51209_c0_seq1.p1 gnl/TRDRNA2_/TRDRNA2_51209_c0~~gnl/TRDRNA2_/TRDRNA2_51209_c0_seq1.p1  ORF type:complete len:300 (+),score=59.16 gnl/TRDRNA2_/TRDRNA2_51209_c0_seq1:75-974(+)